MTYRALPLRALKPSEQREPLLVRIEAAVAATLQDLEVPDEGQPDVLPLLDGRDVGLQGMPGDGHQLLGQEYPRLALRVLLLEHAAVAGIAAAHVGAYHVQQLVPASMESIPVVGTVVSPIREP